MRKSAKQKKIEARVALWEVAIGEGWEISPTVNILLKEENRQKVRLNFRDSDVLKLERKVRLTDKERAKDPLKSTKWVCSERARYTAVKIVRGKLCFKVKREGEGKVKNKEMSNG